MSQHMFEQLDTAGQHRFLEAVPVELKGGVASRKAMPKNRRVVVKGLIDPFHFHQGDKRKVNPIHFIGQVAGMKAVVGRPSDRTDAQEVEGQADCQPPRHQFDAATDTGFFERRFHANSPEFPAERITPCHLSTPAINMRFARYYEPLHF